jgi:uncharacterized protein YpbB
MVDEVLHPMQQHLSSLQYASKVKKYYKEVQVIEGSILSHLQKLNNLQYGNMHFVTYAFDSVEHRTVVKDSKKDKAEKGASHRDSLTLFREGKSMTEIAALRNLALGTIESHLASFVYSGEIDVNELVSESKTKAILGVIEDMGMTATSIRQRLGDDYSFGDIRAVMNYYRRLEEQKKESVTAS